MTNSSRLSALDASFLAVETPTAHMHVGWVAMFSVPPQGRLPDFSELRDHIALRLARAPRYRQKLAPVPLGLNTPEWVDDAAFSVDRHVYRAPGPFHELVDEVMSMPLRRDRPLWEIWICEDPEDSRLASSASSITAWWTASRPLSSARCCSIPPPSPSPGTRGLAPGARAARRAAARARDARPHRPAARPAVRATVRSDLARPRRAAHSGGDAARDPGTEPLAAPRPGEHARPSALAPAVSWSGPNARLTTCRSSSGPTARRSTTSCWRRSPAPCAPT